LHHFPALAAPAERVAAAAHPGDVVATMGAGDVTMLGKEIIAALQVKANRSAPGRSGTASR
jgi:UDP-N-acetylmuramate--alanine ligase